MALADLLGKISSGSDGDLGVLVSFRGCPLYTDTGKLGLHQDQDESPESLHREVDSDGDGFIDLNEFIELNTTGVDSRAALEDLKNAFLIFDIDRNGSISPEELQMVLRSLGDDSSMAECRKMISGVDCDGDGLIDFEEFKIMMMRSVIPAAPTNIED